VNGLNFERWLLKWLCGLSAGKHSDDPAWIVGPWSPPDLWVRILFGEVTFPPRWGVYFDGTLGRQIAPAPRIVSERFDINGELAGLRVSLLGFDLVLLLKTTNALDRIVPKGVWRPNGFEFRGTNGGLVKLLSFSWTQPGSGLGVTIRC
jgi:hypothetical protein